MELVSASKLRRAQEQARATRQYREATYELLARLAAIREVEEQPLFKKRPVNSRLYIIITSNSGLAGAYNTNVLKLLAQSAINDKANKVKSSVIAIGSKGAQFVRRTSDIELLAYSPAFGDQPTQADIQPILRSVVDQYVTEAVDEVRVLYTLSRSGIMQEAINLPLLPAQFDSSVQKPQSTAAMNFEPDVEAVIQRVGPRLIEVQIWQMLLERLANQNYLRMLAMKNA